MLSYPLFSDFIPFGEYLQEIHHSQENKKIAKSKMF